MAELGAAPLSPEPPAKGAGGTNADPRPAAPERYDEIFAGLEAPFAFVDLGAARVNAQRMLAAAAGKPIRIASKSVRCRALLERFQSWSDGFSGLMNLTLTESLWLYGHGFRDLFVAYPTVAAGPLRELAALTELDPLGAPAVIVDSVEHLDLIGPLVRAGAPPVRVVLDIDIGWWPLGGLARLGPKRSPIRNAPDAAALARAISERPGVRLVGLMAYEGLIAGVADRVPGRLLENLAIRGVKRLSAVDVARRRAEIAEAVQAVGGPLEFVNGGGTGSIASTAAEAAVTEVAAGSGFYAPMLFQYYRGLQLVPAAGYALPVVRKPAAAIATALGGGYVASGGVRRDRQPVPVWPAGLALDRQEGAGEAQTPLLGRAARALRVGDNVYMRHAKAGELCERFNTLHLIEDGRLVGEVPTYRGEGMAFL